MKRLFQYISILVLVVSSFAITSPITVEANNRGFDPGRIIDDSIFTDISMTEAQIQKFFDDINSTCLKNYRTQEPLGGGKYGKNVLASRAIWKVSQEHRINPKVIIATLEKEQGLVTTKDCAEWKYRTALGYGCPDSAPCSTFGFSVQLHQGARHFRGFFDQSPGWIVPFTPGTRYVQYNPTASCGGSNVTIQNRATASLYSYTPYQPNAATLAARPGQEVNCGAYGNLNFWQYYTNWFGSTVNINIPGCREATNTSIACVWKLSKNGTSVEVVTTSHSETVKLARSGQYQFSGVDFHVRNRISPQRGNVPVYSLEKPDGSTFITINKGEYDALSSVFTPKGVMFYADPIGSNSGYPVYRLHNSKTGSHVWTSSRDDRARYINRGYRAEGEAFASLSTVRQEAAPPESQALVYRFARMPGNRHFWTNDVYERDSMIKAGYRYEGVAWRSSVNKTSVPVYRLYSPTMKKHLFTTDSYERDVLNRTSSWRYEGVAWYANPSTSGSPVYRLYSSHNAAHFYTTDSYERDVLSRSKVFRYEGVGWRQP